MNRFITLLSVSMVAFLSACGSDPDPEAVADAAPPAPAPAPAAAQAPADDPTIKMARAVGDGKPGAAVNIKYEFVGKPAVGTPTELQIALIPSAGVDAMDAKISGMEGVTLSGTLTPSFSSVEPGKPYTHSFSLLPDRTGVFYVTVAVTTQIGGSSLGRTFSIPFVVGSPPAQKKTEPARDASGEAIQPMKAEEDGDRRQ